MSIQELYSSTVRPLNARDRLRLATLILEELSANEVDVSDSWTDEDLRDLTNFAGSRFVEDEHA